MSKTTKYNFTAWIFVILSFSLIVTIGYKTNNQSNLSQVHKKNTSNHESLMKTQKEIISENKKEEQNDNDKAIIKKTKKEFLIIDEATEEKTNNIYVNKIVISKNIDNDKNSNTYRNPIDAFKTISTLDESVIKEINYYPSIFVWSSINTENTRLIDNEEKLNPINLSMIIKCKDEIIKKLNYSITANTPRWREWIEIDLTNINNEMLDEVWNVEIVDHTTNNILETRNFKLIKHRQIVKKSNKTPISIVEEE